MVLDSDRWRRCRSTMQQDMASSDLSRTPEEASEHSAKEHVEHSRKGWEHSLGQRSAKEIMEHSRKGAKIVGTANVNLRRGVIGANMAEWEAYFPTLEDFIGVVSCK